MVKWFLSLWFAGVVSGLGSDNFKEREAAMRRADNVVFSLLHRPVYDNMECNRRIRVINEKYSWKRVEVNLYYDLPELYWDLFLIPRYNRAFTDTEIANHLMNDYNLMNRFLTHYNPHASIYYYYAFSTTEEMRVICNYRNPKFLTALRVLGVHHEVPMAGPFHP